MKGCRRSPIKGDNLKCANDDIKRNVLRMLNMTEPELEKAVKNINLWLQLQPHLPHILDETVIKSFVVGCRSVEVAKVKLEKYFLARINFPAEISNRDPFKIQWDNIQPLAYLPELTPEGYLVLFLTMPDLNKIPGFDFLQSIRFLAMMSEIVIRERPYMTGLITLVDLKHLSIKLLPKISISNIVNALYIFDNMSQSCPYWISYESPMDVRQPDIGSAIRHPEAKCIPSTGCANELSDWSCRYPSDKVEHVYPLQMKAIYNFNTPQIADSLQKTLIKPIMNDGLYNSIESSTEDERCLAKFVPVNVLPQEYGGNAPPLSHIINDWRVKLENFGSVFLGECALLPDQSKIPKQLADNCQFGSSGTFRKLDID